MNLRKLLNTVLTPTGYEPSRRSAADVYPSDFGAEDKQICDTVRACTMARQVDRIYAVINAVRYVIQIGIPGAIVECGVWRGGMMMAAALALTQLVRTDRDLPLFDTFAGIVQPEEVDRDTRGNLAEDSFRKATKNGEVVDWCFTFLDEVKANMAATDEYLQKQRIAFHLVRGDSSSRVGVKIS